MSATTSIEWTEKTWNPVRGCSVVSPGCVHCYAMKQAHRFSGPGQPYEGLTKPTKAGPQWTGEVRPVVGALLEPLSWRKPSRVFVNSMSDLFHEDVPEAFIDEVFAVMALCPQHTFQVLTKRPRRMQRWVSDNATGGHIFHLSQQVDPSGAGAQSGAWPLPNVWLGVSVEDQQRADERIPLLLQTPAAVRFISAEPLLGPVTFRWAKWDDWTDGYGRPRPQVNELDGLRRLDWVIVGGESGPGARACDVAWVRSLVQQCQAASVPVFVKQLGSRLTGVGLEGPPYSSPPRREGYLVHWTCRDENTFGLCDRKGGEPSEWPEELRVRQFPTPHY